MRRGNMIRCFISLRRQFVLEPDRRSRAKHLAPPRTSIFSAGIKPITSTSCNSSDAGVRYQHEGQNSKGLADIPIQDINLVVSFGDAHKKCENITGARQCRKLDGAGRF